MKRQPTVKSLQAKTRDLEKRVAQLSKIQGMEARNSLLSLVQGASQQANITTFDDILANNIYAPLTLNYTLLTFCYKTHGIIQAAMKMPVMDAIRGGLEIRSDELDGADIQVLQDVMEKIGLLDTIAEAMIWTRLYGGGALILNTEQDPSTALSMNELRGVIEFYAASRWELGSPNRVADKYLFYGKPIHHSRVMTLVGDAAPYYLRWQLAGWGMSEVEKMLLDFNKYLKTNDVIYDLLEEAKVDVFSFENLNSQLVSSMATEKVRQRVALMNELKSYNNAVVLDMKDKFEQKQIAFGGLAEVMKENRIGIASALRIPMAKLFGLSAAGFNSGEDDIENYNAMVESEVRQPMRKVINNVLNIVSYAAFGFQPKLSFDFKPLRVMSSEQEENIKTQKQARILSVYDRGLISSQEVGSEMSKEKLISIQTDAEKGLLPDRPERTMDDQGQGDDDEGEEDAGDKDKKSGRGEGNGA